MATVDQVEPVQAPEDTNPKPPPSEQELEEALPTVEEDVETLDIQTPEKDQEGGEAEDREEEKPIQEEKVGEKVEVKEVEKEKVKEVAPASAAVEEAATVPTSSEEAEKVVDAATDQVIKPVEEAVKVEEEKVEA